MEVRNNNECSKSCKANLTDYGLVIFRLVLGGFMLSHGWQKLSNFEMFSTAFPDPIGLGASVSLSMIIFAEFFCSILLILGLFTRLATIPLIIGMAVAAFVIHGNDPFATKELSLLYLISYVGILFTGAGKYSIDYLLRNFYSSICAIFCKRKK